MTLTALHVLTFVACVAPVPGGHVNLTGCRLIELPLDASYQAQCVTQAPPVIASWLSQQPEVLVLWGGWNCDAGIRA